MYHKQLVLLTAIFLSLFSGYSQTREIDSLTIQLAFQDQDSLKIDTSIELIKSLINQNDYTKAVLYINQSERLASQLNYTKGIAELSYHKAQIFANNKDYKSAIENFGESLKYYTITQDSLGLAKVNNSIGRIQIKNGNYAQGLSYSLSAIDIFEKKNLKDELSVAYNNLAEAYFNTNRFDKSLEFNQKALNVRKELNDIKGIITSTNALAQIYSMRNEHRKAIEYYENALTFLNLEEDDNLRGEILPNIGREYLKFRDFTKASIYLTDALTLNRTTNNKSGTLKSLIYISELNLNLNKVRLAEYQINEAYRLSQEVNDDTLTLETLRMLISVDSVETNYKNAFNWQRQYYQLKDKLEKKNKQPIVIQNPTTLNLEIPEIEPELSKNINEIPNESSNLEIQKLNLIIYSLITLIAILLISLFFLSKNNKKKTQYIANFTSNSSTLKVENIDLKERLENLEEMNEVKNRLFSIVSHDLKDSITSLKSFIDLLKDNSISQDEFDQLIPELSESADNANTLLLNLLSWSKSQMQNLDPKAEYFDIKEVFQEKSKLISKKIGKKRIVLIDESINETVYADRNMIEIVIQNLLANAVKFSRVGDVITISNRKKNGNALICIADTGVGISEENLKKLFKNEGFTTRGTDHEKGTGLGLSICKQLVDLNKGKIWVESEPNLGSKFFVELPRDRQ